jgi:hypothetical protein
MIDDVLLQHLILVFHKHVHITRQYQEIFKVPDIDWCYVMAGGQKSNNMVRTVFRSLSETVPQLFKKCPFVGLFEFPTIRPNKNYITMLPRGTYRYTFKVVSPNDVELIFSVSIDFTE